MISDTRFGRTIEHKILRPIEYFFKKIILSAVPLRDEFILVTGSDRTHYKSLRNLLRSVAAWEPEVRCIVYDLGLEPSQQKEFSALFPSIEMRRFDYSKYPAYFNIRINAGEFAWKPVIFSEVFNEFECCICWFDAGNLLVEPLTWLRKVVQGKGFYSPFGKGTVAEWTHPATLAQMNAEKWIHAKANLSGYCVGANYQSPKARAFVERWRKCALDRACIAPPGSNRYNHRQDMSVLSILTYQIGLPLFFSRFLLGFKCQQDVD